MTSIDHLIMDIIRRFEEDFSWTALGYTIIFIAVSIIVLLIAILLYAIISCSGNQEDNDSKEAKEEEEEKEEEEDSTPIPDTEQPAPNQDDPLASIHFPSADELPEFPGANNIQPHYKVNLTLDPDGAVPEGYPEINLAKCIPPSEPTASKPLKVKIPRSRPKHRRQITVKLAKPTSPVADTSDPNPVVNETPESTSAQEIHDALHQFAETAQTGDLRKVSLKLDAYFDKPDDKSK